MEEMDEMALMSEMDVGVYLCFLGGIYEYADEYDIMGYGHMGIWLYGYMENETRMGKVPITRCVQHDSI